MPIRARGEPLRVLYVYHGTAGVAGAYAHGITRALGGLAEVECHLGVNHYYRFPELAPNVRVHRAFFRLSENTERNAWRTRSAFLHMRLPLRYAELATGYARLLACIVEYDIEVVNFSVIDDEYPSLLFARGVKQLKRQLHVTAHDVVFRGPRSSARRRSRVFELADKLVVHHEHVRTELANRFGIEPQRVIVHPFPWADVEPVIDRERLAHYRAMFARDLA